MATIQTQKAIDRLQAIFNDLPRMVSDIARKDNLNNEQAIDRFVKTIADNVNEITKMKKFDVDGALRSIELLEMEVDFVKNIYNDNLEKFNKYKALAVERDKSAAEIVKLQKQLASVNDAMKMCQTTRKPSDSNVERELQDIRNQMEATQYDLDRAKEENKRLNEEIVDLATNQKDQETQLIYTKAANDEIIGKFKRLMNYMYPNASIETFDDIYNTLNKLILYLRNLGLVVENIEKNENKLQNPNEDADRETIMSLQNQLEDFKADHTDLQLRYDDLLRQKQIKDDEYTSVIEQYKKDIDLLKSQNTRMDEEMSSLNSEHEQSEEIIVECAHLRQNINENQRTIENLQDTVKTLESNRDELMQKYNDESAKFEKVLNSSKTEISRLTGTINDMTNKIDLQEEKIAAIKRLFTAYSEVNATSNILVYYQELARLIDYNSQEPIDEFTRYIDNLIKCYRDMNNKDVRAANRPYSKHTIIDPNHDSSLCSTLVAVDEDNDTTTTYGDDDGDDETTNDTAYDNDPEQFGMRPPPPSTPPSSSQSSLSSFEPRGGIRTPRYLGFSPIRKRPGSDIDGETVSEKIARNIGLSTDAIDQKPMRSPILLPSDKNDISSMLDDSN